MWNLHITSSRISQTSVAIMEVRRYKEWRGANDSYKDLIMWADPCYIIVWKVDKNTTELRERNANSAHQCEHRACGVETSLLVNKQPIWDRTAVQTTDTRTVMACVHRNAWDYTHVKYAFPHTRIRTPDKEIWLIQAHQVERWLQNICQAPIGYENQIRHSRIMCAVYDHSLFAQNETVIVFGSKVVKCLKSK